MHHRTTLNAALRAADRGWHVFPLVPGAKRPAVRAWEPRATTDPDRLAACWKAGDFNYGVATGPSHLIVVDLDVPKRDQDTPTEATDGTESLALLAARHGRPYPSDTYTVRTASGGTHLYFVTPESVKLRNTAGKLGWKIDTRANGGYVVGAGSTVDGKPYTVVRNVAPAPLPDWLTRLLTPAALPSQCRTPVPLRARDRRGAYLTAALKAERDRVRGAAEGNRNHALYQSAVALGQLVAGGELTDADVTGWLTSAALGNGLTESEARRTIASGLRAGAQRPRPVVGRRAA